MGGSTTVDDGEGMERYMARRTRVPGWDEPRHYDCAVWPELLRMKAVLRVVELKARLSIDDDAAVSVGDVPVPVLAGQQQLSVG